jgi:hypothetical protein
LLAWYSNVNDASVAAWNFHQRCSVACTLHEGN